MKHGAADDAITQGIASASPLATGWKNLLVAEPPYFSRDGGFIRSGAHAPLDEVRALRDESRRVIASLENKYRGASGIAALKIKHNGVLGYFIEVTQQHADKLMTMKEETVPSPPDHGGGGAFFHRRTRHSQAALPKRANSRWL